MLSVVREMPKVRFFLLLFACSAPLAAVTEAAVYAGQAGIYIHWGMTALAPVAMTTLALVVVRWWTPGRRLAAFGWLFVLAWILLIVLAAGWGLLLDAASVPIWGWDEWPPGGLVWASSHGGGRTPGVLGLPFVYVLYGWVFAIVAAIIKTFGGFSATTFRIVLGALGVAHVLGSIAGCIGAFGFRYKPLNQPEALFWSTISPLWLIYGIGLIAVCWTRVERRLWITLATQCLAVLCCLVVVIYLGWTAITEKMDREVAVGLATLFSLIYVGANAPILFGLRRYIRTKSAEPSAAPGRGGRVV